MSNPNLDSRYIKPADVDSKIAAQAVTDAGQYALQGKAIISVTDSAYNADMTGGTDAAMAIQAAINAANAAGGGTVTFPRGTARIKSTLTLYSNVTLKGAGREATVIKLWDNANCDLIQSYQFLALTGGNTNGGIQRAAIRDLTIDGNKTNNTSGYGFRHYGCLLEMDNVIVRQCAQDGIYSEWSNSAVIADGCESNLTNITATYNGGNGITWAGSHDSAWKTCIAAQNSGKGFHIKQGAAIHVAVACHSWGLNQTYAWYIESETHLLSCQGEGASIAQVMIGANDTIIKGGKYFGFNSTMLGIQVGDAAHASVTGVVIDTKTINLPAGAIDFTYAGANGFLDLINYQSSTGNVLIAPANVRGSWFFRIVNTGSGTLAAGDQLNVAGSMTVRGGSNALLILGSKQWFNFNAVGGSLQVVNGAPISFYSDNYATKTIELQSANGHIVSGGTAIPTSTAATAAGTGATISVAGNDMAGTITLTTGTSPSTGLQATIAFANAYGSAPKVVQFCAESGSAALLNPYTASKSTTAMGIGFAVAPAASTVYNFNYQVIQ